MWATSEAFSFSSRASTCPRFGSCRSFLPKPFLFFFREPPSWARRLAVMAASKIVVRIQCSKARFRCGWPSATAVRPYFGMVFHRKVGRPTVPAGCDHGPNASLATRSLGMASSRGRDERDRAGALRRDRRALERGVQERFRKAPRGCAGLFSGTYLIREHFPYWTSWTGEAVMKRQVSALGLAAALIVAQVGIAAAQGSGGGGGGGSGGGGAGAGGASSGAGGGGSSTTGGTGQSSTTGGTNQGSGAGSVGQSGRPTSTGRPTDSNANRPLQGEQFAPGSRNPPTTPGSNR
jgi:hypothetical protein